MDRIRVTVSLLAPRIRVAGTKDRYVGILNRNALHQTGAKAWGPLGGAATIAALPNFKALAEKYSIELCEKESPDLRFWVDRADVEKVIADLIVQIPTFADQDFRRELVQELTGKELHRLSREQILTAEQVARIGVRFIRHVRQPSRAGEFVRSQREKSSTSTKRLFFLYELTVSRRIFKRMCRSKLMREFDADHLPSADDPPTEPIVLEDGTERRGHLMRF